MQRPTSLSPRRRTVTAWLALSLLLTFFFSTVFASSAPADTEDAAPTTVWSLTPAPQEDDEDRVSFRFDVPPGDSVEDAVELTNFSAQEATFTLQAADGVVSESGTFDILRPGEENEAAGQWIELDQQEVTVPADESVTVPFTLTVPENATPGDQPAGIAASVSTDEGDDVSMVSRVGARIHLRVDGDIMPTLAVEDLDVQYSQNWNPFAPGTATVSWTVRNTGNVRLGAQQALSSSALFGLATVEESVEPIREILPGGEAQLQVEQEVLPLFVLNSTVSLEPSVVGDDEVDAELSTATGGVTAAAIPIPQLIIVVLVGVLVWWLVTRKKRQSRKFDAAVAAAAAERSTSSGDSDAEEDESGSESSSDDAEDTDHTGAAAKQRSGRRAGGSRARRNGAD